MQKRNAKHKKYSVAVRKSIADSRFMNESVYDSGATECLLLDSEQRTVKNMLQKYTKAARKGVYQSQLAAHCYLQLDNTNTGVIGRSCS